MSGPDVSIVISPAASAQRLSLSVRSAAAAGEACGAPFEIVVALADADRPTREVAEALAHPRLRLSAGSAASTRAAAELAWGEIVVLMEGGDLVSPHYVARLAMSLRGGADARIVARPVACMTYGGAPSMRMQECMVGGAADRARLVFTAPFAPPMAAARALLVGLPPRAWSVEADWAWTAETLAVGVRHEVAEGTVYAAWSPPVVPAVGLPPLRETHSQAVGTSWANDGEEVASDAEVAALLYTRAAQARLGALEAAAQADRDRLQRLTGDVGGLETALAAALHEAARARGDVAALQASTSWKATAPLRALASLAKPGRRR